MLQLHSQSFQSSPSVTRRNFLQIGAPLLGLTFANLLRLESRAAEEGRPTSKKSLIVFWTDGGISQQDSYDPKPDSPAEYRGMYQPIRTSVPGIVLSERLPQQAKVMHRLSVVRSVHHENGIHAPSAHWMQTGYFGPTLARNAPQKPSLGSVISRSSLRHSSGSVSSVLSVTIIRRNVGARLTILAWPPSSRALAGREALPTRRSRPTRSSILPSEAM